MAGIIIIPSKQFIKKLIICVVTVISVFVFLIIDYELAIFGKSPIRNLFVKPITEFQLEKTFSNIDFQIVDITKNFFTMDDVYTIQVKEPGQEKYIIECTDPIRSFYERYIGFKVRGKLSEYLQDKKLTVENIDGIKVIFGTERSKSIDYKDNLSLDPINAGLKAFINISVKGPQISKSDFDVNMHSIKDYIDDLNIRWNFFAFTYRWGDKEDEFYSESIQK